jgi:transposase
MFLKKSIKKVNGKTYCHYKIVESYREGDKIKHRILFPLGALSNEQAERMRLAVSAYSNPNIVVSKADEIVVTKHAAYLSIAVLHHLWQDWELNHFFSKDRWVEAMVINRCLDPVSKIGLKEWMQRTVLPAYLDIDDPTSLNEFDVYRELDRLHKMDCELQPFLYRQIRERRPGSQNAFFYDITSTYVTGNRCVLASLGYSRDHRPDCEQIVIALMVTPEGYPFYWRVMEGNTQDITTITDLVRDTKTRFDLDSCTMVFDRGMVSTENLKALEGNEWKYVTAMDRDEIQSSQFFESALPEPPMPNDYDQVMAVQEFIPVDENALMYYREFAASNRRHILTFDVARFLQERNAHTARMNAFEKWMAKKNQSLRQAKKARSRDVLEQEITNVLKRKRLKKFIAVHIEESGHEITNKRGQSRTVHSFQLSYTTDTAALKKELRLHGITCFLTNLSGLDYPAPEIIQWYRRKNKIEEAFHEIKSHLELRPIFLTRAERVMAHVTVCVLAYFLYNDMQQRLIAGNVNISPEEVFRLFEECKINRILFKQTNQANLSITEPSTRQKEVLGSINCETVIEQKYVNQVLKKVKNWL